jgi:plastocyanin
MALLLLGGNAHGGIDVGSDGSDGALNVATNTEIDLSQAVPAPWNTASPQPGKGVYDAEKWAVVFKYTSVDIAAGATVTFKNHGSRAPVVWLVQGDVIISGSVVLDGAAGHAGGVEPRHAEPGPGGFLGGQGSHAVLMDNSGGFGPGGAFWGGWGAGGPGGSYATAGTTGPGGGTPAPTYGNAAVLPLIGGSGGAGGRSEFATAGGGAGAGAILIASAQTILVRTGASLRANGGTGGWPGGGGGSGGAIRLLADRVTVETNATVRALGGSAGPAAGLGGLGRIRLEANTISSQSESAPPATSGPPGPVFPPSESPTVRAVALASQPVPAYPYGGFFFPYVDMTIGTYETVTLQIEARNLDVASTLTVRVGLRAGQAFTVPATFVGGNHQLSTWRAEFALPHGMSAIQVLAKLP